MEMAAQSFVHHFIESFSVFFQHTGTFFEGNACRTIAAFVNGMAGSLVTEKFDVDVVMQCILQQIDYIAMVGYGTGDSSVYGIGSQPVGFRQIGCDMLYPPLAVAGFYA